MNVKTIGKVLQNIPTVPQKFRMCGLCLGYGEYPRLGGKIGLLEVISELIFKD